MLNKKEMGQKISALRKEANLSQTELGHKIGYQQADISRIEKGTKDLTFSALVDIAQLFNVSADYLLGISEAKTNNKDLQFICDYTGFSDDVIEELHYRKTFIDLEGINKTENKKIYYDSINGMVRKISREHYLNIINCYTHIVKAINDIDDLVSLCDNNKDLNEYNSEIANETESLHTNIKAEYDLSEFEIYKIQKEIKFDIIYILGEKMKEFYSKYENAQQKYFSIHSKLMDLEAEKEEREFEEYCNGTDVSEGDELNGNDN